MDFSSRRDVLKAGAIVSAFPAVMRGAPGQAIKVGLVGCGGRGTGAAAQALKADDYTVLTAVADIDQGRVDECLGTLKKASGAKADEKVKVAKANQFLGLDAFQKLINSDVDVVLLATPPGFRPTHLRAVIEAGKHVFCEKPIAVDAPGVRSVLETVKMAKAKNLNLVAGSAGVMRTTSWPRLTRSTTVRSATLWPITDVLRQSGEADAASIVAPGWDERCGVADSQLVQLPVALRR
jgi:hypothetical protein